MLKLIFAAMVGVLALLQSSGTTMGAQTAGQIEGTVYDSLGAVLGGVVVIRPDLPGRLDSPPGTVHTLRADASGRFALELSPGFYDVCVMSDAFEPICSKVLVRAAATARPNFTLRPNPEVFRRIGERI